MSSLFVFCILFIKSDAILSLYIYINRFLEKEIKIQHLRKGIIFLEFLKKWTVCNGICISNPRWLCVYAVCSRLCGSSIEHMLRSWNMIVVIILDGISYCLLSSCVVCVTCVYPKGPHLMVIGSEHGWPISSVLPHPYQTIHMIPRSHEAIGYCPS